MKKLLLLTLIIVTRSEPFALKSLFGKLFYCESLNKKPTAYTINLMWINKEASNHNTIFPAHREKEFFSTIFAWHKNNLHTKIVIWYNSQTTTPQAISQTQKIINKRWHQNCIILKDIQNLPIVTEHPEIFSSKIPLYFRVDLLRAIIAYHELINKNCNYFVYADLDFEPLKSSQLCSSKLRTILDAKKFIFAYEYNKLGFENGFQIFAYDAQLLAILKKTVIESNIMHAYHFIKNRGDQNSFLEENVFYSYALMHAEYHFLNQYDTDALEIITQNTQKMPARLLIKTSGVIELLKTCPVPTLWVAFPVSSFSHPKSRGNTSDLSLEH